MKIVGGTVTIVDDETGESTDYTFTDSPLNRWTDGIYDAADMFGLSRDEAAVLAFYAMTNKGAEGIPTRSIPPMFKTGVADLVARGWMGKQGRRIGILHDIPELEVIFRAGAAAARFGGQEATTV